jgi:hypothetical protein
MLNKIRASVKCRDGAGAPGAVADDCAVGSALTPLAVVGFSEEGVRMARRAN